MTIPSSVADFWGRFVKASGGIDPARFSRTCGFATFLDPPGGADAAQRRPWGALTAFSFGDNEQLASSLAALVLDGTKRATAGSMWSFEAEGKRAPRQGDLSVVTSWAGTPLCVIETTRVDIVPFDEVSAEFAATEGEGDGSLAYWRQAHQEYFTRECARIGRAFTGVMPVACERFEVIFKEACSPA